MWGQPSLKSLDKRSLLMRFARKMMVSLLGLTLALTLVPITPETYAQDSEALVAAPISGRYQITVPEGWVTSRQQIRGLQGIFLDEIVAIGDSEEALTSLADLDPSRPKLGKTLIANIFPTALAWQGQPTNDAQQIFNNILGPNGQSAEFFDIDGLPSARTRDYFGPPYTNADYAGQTMILKGALIYYLIYSGQSEADLMALEAIAETFSVLDEGQPSLSPQALGERPAFNTSDGRFQVDIGPDWIIAQSGSGPSESFLIMPEPEAMLAFTFGGQFSDNLPGLFVQVLSQPYDAIFGTANFSATAEDRGRILDQAIGSVGGIPTGQTSEFTVGETPAIRVELDGAFGGDNRGVVVVVDPNQTMYSLTIAGPADRWETEYLPLAEAMIDSLSVNYITPVELTGEDVPIGTQVGQRAPDFTVTLTDGRELALSDLRGQVVLLNFWATWCAPCRFEMPEFQSVFLTNQDAGFIVLAVNVMERLEQIETYAAELGLTFPIALDPNGAINSLYRVTGYPSTYIIDANGVIRAFNAGPVTADQVAQWIEMARS
jgi:peroxiredoxin